MKRSWFLSLAGLTASVIPTVAMACGLFDLSIIKSGPPVIDAGGRLTYTLVVRETGDGAARGVTVTDPIPAGLVYLPAETRISQPGLNCQQVNQNIVCNLDKMGGKNLPGIITISLTFQVPQSMACSIIENTATVSGLETKSGERDKNRANNTSAIVYTKVNCPGVPPPPSNQHGCIEVLKEAFDPHGLRLPTVPQILFYLDSQQTAYSDSGGHLRFTNVPVGTHTVTEAVPQGWTQLLVTPANGTVHVQPGTQCAAVVFKNKQNSVSDSLPQCSDGIDNDADGSTDFNDLGCYTNGIYNPSDNDETNVVIPLPQCRDGADNDGDGKIDMQDPGCGHPDDSDETNVVIPLPQCSDGIDNVDPEDNLADFNDLGCYQNGIYNPNDNDEYNQTQLPACRDGVDNDGDGKIDMQDPGCSHPDDNDEFNNRAQCDDGIDNDGDGKIDFPNDPGCFSRDDNDEFNVVNQNGCIDVIKETFDTRGRPLTPVAQFTFRLDGSTAMQNDGSGRVRFSNVSAGSHVVTEDLPPGWVQDYVSPQGGQVHVQAGSQCAVVIFKNRQHLGQWWNTGFNVHTASSSSSFSSQSSSQWWQSSSTANNYENEVIVNTGGGQSSTQQYQSVFSDVNPATIEGQAAAYLNGRGIIGGFPDGTFKGIRLVNRAELSKFVLLAANVNVPEASNNGRFWDVLDGQWYVKYVVKAADMGIIQGYSDGSFRPANTVTAAEFLKMVSVAFNLQVSNTGGQWYEPHMQLNAQMNLLPGVTDPHQMLSRSQVAVGIWKVMTR